MVQILFGFRETNPGSRRMKPWITTILLQPPGRTIVKRLTFVLCLVCTLLISTVAHAATVRTVALSGQHAPGAPDGVNYATGFTSPTLNDAGRTAFHATLAGSGVDETNNQGIWSEGFGSLALVARRGSPAPDMSSGISFGELTLPYVVLNNSGQTAFHSFLTGSGVDDTNNQGIWLQESSGAALMSRTGTAAPGTPEGVNFNSFGGPLLGEAGKIGFFAGLAGSSVSSGNNLGIWSNTSGSPELVIRKGDPPSSGTVFLVYAEFSSAALNAVGKTGVFFRLNIGSHDVDDQGLWTDRSGSGAWVARGGWHAPGTSQGVNFTVFGRPFFGFFTDAPSMNDAGQLAFHAKLRGPGVNSTNDEGIWSEGSGAMALVAREGSPAPGMPNGVNFSIFTTPIVLNNARQTAFGSFVTGSGVVDTNSAAIWSEGSGSLALVARAGDHAPGTPNGVFFNCFCSTSDSLLLNDAGQTAFYTDLTGSGVDSTNDHGIWETGSTGALQLIARTGDMLEIAPGDIRTISSLGGIANSGFNNLGQLAFYASFTDGTSGIFVSNRVAVPEPSSLLLLCLGSLAALWRRRSLVCASILAAVVCTATSANAVTIDMVTVGNPGNAPDTEVMTTDGTTGYGSVGYIYQIGKYEVTAGQYTEFLNAVGKADPNALYNGTMNSSLGANIQRSGSSPNFSYSVASNWANRPINYVDFWVAARFANWLHNGQPTGAQGPGTTEEGAYHDVGNQTLFGRNAGAKFFIPTEDEWYKAAYHDNSAGLAGSYFDYPTGTNLVPGNDMSEATNPGNNANFYSSSGGYVLGSPYYRTDVGEFELSDSPYGTFDQGGNVFEWNETTVISASRGLRGGSFDNFDSGYLRADLRLNLAPTGGGYFVGFRVASIAVPEPSTMSPLVASALACVGCSFRRRRLHPTQIAESPATRVTASVLLLGCLVNFHLALPATAAPVTVPVGNAANPPDQNYAGQGQFGAVPYGYRIAIHEVTNAEYAAFLNFKVSIYYDPFYFASLTFNDSKALLNESMLYESRGGLTVVNLPTPCYSGGGFCPPPGPPPHFEARLNHGDKPVKFVSWYDALRFVNWLNNGQSYGSTETGAYTLGPLGAAGVPVNPNAITRNPGTTWVLPNEDEWYKAAYYQPADSGGDGDGYWLSPTRSNVTSAVYAAANSTGNISNPGANVMNESGANWYGLVGNVTTVGSAGPLSASYYGTLDQGGNVQEWLESLGSGGRVARGGSWDGDNNIGFRADQRRILSATYESADLGFRVAQLVPIVPEPSTFALAALGFLGLATRRARRNVAVRTNDPESAPLDARTYYYNSPGRLLMKPLTCLCLVGLLCAAARPVQADIFQWEYINPANTGLGKQQSSTLCPDGGGVNAVPGGILNNRNLTLAYLIAADLTSASVVGVNLWSADLSQAHLTNANLTNANFELANLTGADLTGAEVRGTNFVRSNYAYQGGISLAQLYSTASYQAHDLTGINLAGNNLAGVYLAGHNLTNVNLNSDLSNANLSKANLTNANLQAGLWNADLSQANMTHAIFYNAKLDGANLSQANLRNADLTYASLYGANLSGAEVRGAYFFLANVTLTQLYSTASYQAHDLTGIHLEAMTLSGANFADQNLTNANFNYTNLTGADLTGAVMRGAQIAGTGVTLTQIYSTASYLAHDLTGIGMFGYDLSGAVFSDQNLSYADFRYANFTGANLTHANVANATFSDGMLNGANLSQANLTNASFYAAKLSDANLSGADARGANFAYATLTGANTTNLIQSDGHIAGLDLTAGASLVARDYDGNPAVPAIVVEQHLAMDATGTLRMVFEGDAWDSTISFAPNISIARSGTLELTFAPDVNLASQIGRTIDLFDWTAVTPTGTFTVSSPYSWNLTNLYTTGEVTLAAVPGILPGDFNNDSKVDAADYITWRKNGGTTAAYGTWRANFGQTAGSGSRTVANAAVPDHRR